MYSLRTRVVKRFSDASLSAHFGGLHAGTDGLDLAQDARALVSHLTERGKLEHTFGPGRGGYLYVMDGRLSLDGDSLRTGDAAKVMGEVKLELATEVGAELILIDVPLEFESVGVWANE